MENNQNINSSNEANEQDNRAFLQQMLNRNIQRSEFMNVDKILSVLLSKTFFLVSLSISMISYFLIYVLLKDKHITYKDLEKEEMNLYYIGMFLLILCSIWNVFLLFYQIIFNFDYTRINLSDESITNEMLYLSPIFSVVLIYYINKDYLTTGFDLFFLLTIFYFYKINFFFTVQISSYFNNRINTIHNINDQTFIIFKFRLAYLIFILINIVFTYSIKLIIDEVPFTYKYMILFRGLFLLFKQIEMLIINEYNLKNNNPQYAMSEEFLLKSNFRKNFLLLLNMFMLLQKLIFINQILFLNGVFFITLPLTFIIGRYIYKMISIYRSYYNLKNFIEKLELIFPKIHLENNEEECTICKEQLTHARKLSCNHLFHLICLSKWIEKGNKNCPLCRKEIEMYRNLINNNENNNWSFSFRLERNFIFSWLPSFSFSFFGDDSGSNLSREEMLNTIHEMFPNTRRENIQALFNSTGSLERTINELLLG